MAREYYTDDCDRLPIRTMVRLLSNQVPLWLAIGLTLWLRFLKLIGRSPKPTYASAWQEYMQVQPLSEMPARAQSCWARHFELLGDLGFELVACGESDTIGAKAEAAALMVHESGRTLVLLEWLRQIGAEGVEEQSPLEFKSYPTSGPELCTIVMPEEYMALAGIFTPDFMDIEHLSNRKSLKYVFRKHSERIAEIDVLEMSPESGLREYQSRRQRLFDYLIETGYLRQLTTDEIATVREHTLPD